MHTQTALRQAGTTTLNQSRTQSKANEVTGITETVGTAWIDPAHDKAGNMITLPKPASPASGLTATYDAWNRLVKVEDGASTIGKYEYDALHRRVKRHVDTDAPSSPNGVDNYIHYFYNSAWETLETRSATTESAQPENLQPKYQYVWSRRYVDAPVLRDKNTDQDSLCDDQRLYYLNDANFNVTTLVDVNGDAVERYLYSPYGTPIIYDATWSNIRSASSYDNTILYTGREYDSESGLYHYRHRYYHAQLGRFINRDPIGYLAKDFNLYRYVGNQPVTATDSEGLTIIPPPNLVPVCNIGERLTVTVPALDQLTNCGMNPAKKTLGASAKISITIGLVAIEVSVSNTVEITVSPCMTAWLDVQITCTCTDGGWFSRDYWDCRQIMTIARERRAEDVCGKNTPACRCKEK